MPVPRILFVVPGLLAGLLIPALTSAPKEAPAGTVGMVGMNFSQKVVKLHRGERLTFFNSSNLVHIVGPGTNGHILTPTPGVPILGWHLMPTNSVYKSPPWTTDGTFHITCSVHPDMNLEVIVTS
jgi:plastocyanin